MATITKGFMVSSYLYYPAATLLNRINLDNKYSKIKDINFNTFFIFLIRNHNEISLDKKKKFIKKNYCNFKNGSLDNKKISLNLEIGLLNEIENEILNLNCKLRYFSDCLLFYAKEIIDKTINK